MAGDFVQIRKGVLVTDDTSKFASPMVFMHPALPDASAITTDPTNAIRTAKASTTTLAPGKYGDLIAQEIRVINLSADEYSFDRIKDRKNLDLNVDLSGGEISILVKGNVKIQKNLEVDLVRGRPEDIFLEAQDRKIKIAKNAQW